MGLIADVKTLLSSIDTTNCYLGDMPDSPDDVLCIYETGGYPAELNLNGDAIDRPTFMIKVRNTTHAGGITKCELIKAALSSVSNTTINGHFYLSIRQQSDILSLGKDARNRSEFSINFKAEIAR